MKYLIVVLLFVVNVAKSQMIINASKNYTSGSVGYRYWGWVNTNTPSNATITSLNKDAQKVLSLYVKNQIPTGSQYYVYCYPTTLGSISNIIVNNFDFTAAFTTITVTLNGQSYQKIISNNKFSLKASISYNP